MNKNQINDILAKIENFNQINVEEILSAVFQNQDIQNIRIGQYTVPEYISVTKRLFKQFKNEINENGDYLPFQYNFQNEFGAGSLNNDIQNIINNINAKNPNNLNNTIGFINRLVYYQIINGFWDKSTRKVHKYNEIKISELKDQLDVIANQLSSNSDLLKTQINSLKKEQDNLTQFINQKNKELQQIATNLQSSNTNTSQIAKLLNNSTSTNEKINSILTQQTQSLENIKKKIETENQVFEKQKSIFKEQESISAENIETIKTQIDDFNEKLKFVESKKAYFEERNNYLKELIGREVGVSLFETFKQRKKELENPVNNWQKVVIGMAILTFLAIITIFTNVFGLIGGEIPKEFTITQLIMNSIKTLPFFFLLFYSISQYNKERNFQEEYAFKSAVALTIKAYSDIIQKDELKDELIFNSVGNVYKSPTIQKTKKTKDDNSMLETAKDLLSTALDVMKKK
ncbi:MAG: hypothetical protein K9I94_03695 [Bacteroidales bacterium]|nr:hypothetical protein [Bacteroidales bacterium]